jgi:dUTP pyrophosphatase
MRRKIKIKYFSKDIDKLSFVGGRDKSDWIDLRSAEDIELKKGEFHLIPLGVGMKLPKGYEANIVPRSSTYKNFKILQTNCFAVIDNSYSGNEDQWMMPVVAMEDTVIHKNDRICQFRINKIQPTIKLEEVENLDDASRGGIGSTGKV